LKPEPRSDEQERADEHDLVLRARIGDREAFGLLVTRYMRRAYYVALGLVGSHDDAQDLSQEAFARVYRNHEQLDAERSFYGLVYRVLRRLCFNHLRDTKNRAAKLEEQGAWLMDEARSRQSDADTTRRAELNELRSLLSAAIQALTANEREVFVLKEFDGLRYREISDLLDIPIGTVMSRLYAARRSLANSLGDAP